MKKILVINSTYEEEIKEMIRTAATVNHCEVDFADSEAAAGDLAMEAEIIYGIAPKAAASSEKLEWLCLPSAGADLFCKPGAIGREEVILTNSAGAYGVTLAEHTLMLTLMLIRREPEFAAGIANHQWLSPRKQHSIKDSRITLLGAGDIGRNVAKRLIPFEPAKITAVNRSGKSSEKAFDEVLPQDRLAEVLPETDILIMSLPGTAETYHIINEETLALMPEDSFIVNVGRGTAIDQAALKAALDADQLAGAALDVCEVEPLPAEDPLWDTKNLLLTPHVAGNMTVNYTRRRNAEMFCEDLANYMQDKPMNYLVDRKAGY